MNPVFDRQIDDLVGAGPHLWRAFDGKSILMTGGTGFFGQWLLAALFKAEQTLNVRVSVAVVTRDAAAFRERAPELAKAPSLRFIKGDIRSFPLPEEQYDFVIHGAATSARDTFDGERPLPKFDMALDGMRRVLEAARSSRAILRTRTAASAA